MKRAVFFDIDGTLLDCLNGITDITLRVKKAIRALQECIRKLITNVNKCNT